MNERAYFKFLFKIYVREVSEKLSELKGDDAIKFLEEELNENERYREFAIQELMQAERIRKFLRKQLERVKGRVKGDAENSEE